MAGIGKTTLAIDVYNHRFIIKHFDFRAWVTVSQDYSPHTFWRTLLLGLVDSTKLFHEQMCRDEFDESAQKLILPHASRDEIASIVCKILFGRRSLIIMDDVWDTQEFDDVRRILEVMDNGSRIILTSRISEVATYWDPHSSVHEMSIMNDSQSWNLIKKKVFPYSKCPPDLEDIGKEIARKCSGLPLAVVLVAGILSEVHETRSSWLEIAKTVDQQLVDPEIEKVLSLSYTNLPHHLRPFFLHFGCFRSDVNIHASRLIKLWEAKGILKHQNEYGESLEEQGEKLLGDLARRNLVIVNSRKINGKIKSCSLHDIVRRFCIKKAREEKMMEAEIESLNKEKGVDYMAMVGLHAKLRPRLSTSWCAWLRARFEKRLFRCPTNNPEDDISNASKTSPTPQITDPSNPDASPTFLRKNDFFNCCAHS